MQRPHARSQATRPQPSDGSVERSTDELLMAIADDTKHLITKEIELARHEIVQALMARAMAVGAFAVAGILGLMILVFGGLTAVAGLDQVMPAWASRLVVTGALVVLAGVAALFGKAKLRKPSLVPEETKRTIKEGEAWAVAQLQR